MPLADAGSCAHGTSFLCGDMRIGLDIASIAYKRLADTIVLISGDSDFVPAAKHARREGIDFILDPMWQKIRSTLNRHVDGLRSCVARDPSPENEPLCVKNSVPEREDARRASPRYQGERI